MSAVFGRSEPVVFTVDVSYGDVRQLFLVEDGERDARSAPGARPSVPASRNKDDDSKEKPEQNAGNCEDHDQRFGEFHTIGGFQGEASPQDDSGDAQHQEPKADVERRDRVVRKSP